MFKSPLYVIAVALAVFVILNGMTALCVFWGVSTLTISATTVLLTLVSCAVVAAKDPTYGTGYWFGGAFAAAAVGDGIGSSVPVMLFGAIIGGSYLLAMWATYCVRRHRNTLRLRARFRELGM